MREAISVKRTRVVLAGCVATVFLTGSLVGCGGLTASPDIPDGGTAAQSSSSGGSQATAYPIACPVYGDLTACGQSDPPAYVIVEHASSADGGPWREPGGRVDDCAKVLNPPPRWNLAGAAPCDMVETGRGLVSRF